MTNEEAARACDEIYNGFWLKYRDRPLKRHDDDWERIHTHAVVLLQKYSFPLATDMVRAFLDELEERVRRREERGL